MCYTILCRKRVRLLSFAPAGTSSRTSEEIHGPRRLTGSLLCLRRQPAATMIESIPAMSTYHRADTAQKIDVYAQPSSQSTTSLDTTRKEALQLSGENRTSGELRFLVEPSGDCRIIRTDRPIYVGCRCTVLTYHDSQPHHLCMFAQQNPTELGEIAQVFTRHVDLTLTDAGYPRVADVRLVKVRPTRWPGFAICSSTLMHTRMGQRLLARAP